MKYKLPGPFRNWIGFYLYHKSRKGFGHIRPGKVVIYNDKSLGEDPVPTKIGTLIELKARCFDELEGDFLDERKINFLLKSANYNTFSHNLENAERESVISDLQNLLMHLKRD